MDFIDTYKIKNPNQLEYSWVGRTGNGYRYDYAFFHKNSSLNLIDCFFLHTIRENKLSDHSALILKID